MSDLTVSALFTIAEVPATGLTLSDIKFFLTQQDKSTGADTVIWDGTQVATIEINNVGMYTRILSTADLNLYSYFAMVQYIGATVLDNEYIYGSAGQVESDTRQIEGIDATNQIRDSILSDATPFAGANINATITSRSSQASVDAIDDFVDELETRLTALRAANLDNLDATISSRASQTSMNTVDDLVDDLETRLTATRAGYLDNLSAGAVALQTSVDDLEGRLTAARAGYLDNLNIGGLVASSAEATAIQNNTRVVRVVPGVIERPDSGTTTYRIELLLYDETGNMEAPDSAPTITLVNQAGTDLSSRLDSATMALVSTGRYRAIYTAAVANDLEQLVWTFSVIEGGATRLYGNTTIIVDTSAVDFTASDRTTLNLLTDGTVGLAALETLVDDLEGRLTALRAANLDNLDALISSRATPAQVATALATYDAPTHAELVSEINSVQTDIAALNDISSAEVNTEVDQALADINLDHLVGTATGIPAIIAGTYLDQIMDDGTATFDRTTDSLQAIADNAGGGEVTLSAATLLAIAKAVLKKGIVSMENDGDFEVASLGEVILAHFESSIVEVDETTGNWVIRKVGGTTFNTRTVNLDATALPVKGVT